MLLPRLTRQPRCCAAIRSGVISGDMMISDTVMSGVSSFNAGTVLMTVADVETMIIKAGINEVDIGKVRLEQPVKVSLDAYPKVKFAGLIKRIAPAARLVARAHNRPNFGEVAMISPSTCGGPCPPWRRRR